MVKAAARHEDYGISDRNGHLEDRNDIRTDLVAVLHRVEPAAGHRKLWRKSRQARRTERSGTFEYIEMEVWTNSGTAVYLVKPAAGHKDRLPLFLNAPQPARLTEVREAGAVNRLLDVVDSGPAVPAENEC